MLPVTASPPRRQNTAAPIAKASQTRSRSSARAAIRGALSHSPDRLYCSRSAGARNSHLLSGTPKVRNCISVLRFSPSVFRPKCTPGCASGTINKPARVPTPGRRGALPTQAPVGGPRCDFRAFANGESPCLEECRQPIRVDADACTGRRGTIAADARPDRDRRWPPRSRPQRGAPGLCLEHTPAPSRLPWTLHPSRMWMVIAEEQKSLSNRKAL
jgi:hypothetical protein